MERLSDCHWIAPLLIIECSFLILLPFFSFRNSHLNSFKKGVTRGYHVYSFCFFFSCTLLLLLPLLSFSYIQSVCARVADVTAVLNCEVKANKGLSLGTSSASYS